MEPLESDDDIWTGLRTRIASAVVMAVVTLVCVSIGGVIFTGLVILAAIVMLKEWETLTAREMLIMRLSGYPYVILPCACLLWLRGLKLPPENDMVGLSLVIGLIVVITATDTGAYFTGRRFGRHKLAPAISPKKTWEGLAGGVILATVTALMASPYMQVPHSAFAALWVGPLIALLAQAGDLSKSWVKRIAGVKDSGTLIPGHGGVLDRLDGYIFTTPVFAFIIYCALHT